MTVLLSILHRTFCPARIENGKFEELCGVVCGSLVRLETPRDVAVAEVASCSGGHESETLLRGQLNLDCQAL
jgi:hypothetical protein